MESEHLRLELDGVTLSARAAGRGPAVVLLHGFPEFSYSWRSQLPALARAGFRAIAPDLRGYNQSDKPAGIRAYAADRLVGDIVSLIERHAGGRAFVVGHDWGGVIAWLLAALRPDLVRKLVVLNAPHPAAFRRVLATNATQWLRSSYVILFQIPGIAERILSAGNFALFERAFRRQPTNREAFSPEDLAAYKRSWREPGALTAGLNYYRAALWYPGSLSKGPQSINVPTLLIWGERDSFLSKQLSVGLDRWVKKLQVVRLPAASHWVQNEAPAEVNQHLLDFF